MNKIIMFIGIFLMISVVGAVAIGSVYTQDQVDSIDIFSFDLEEQFVRNEGNNIEYECDDGICNVWTEILDMNKEMLVREVFDDETNETVNETYWSGDWEIVYPKSEIKFRKQRWADLRDETNATYARKDLVNWLKAKRSRLVAARRTKLEGIQTQSDVDLSDVLDNLN